MPHQDPVSGVPTNGVPASGPPASGPPAGDRQPASAPPAGDGQPVPHQASPAATDQAAANEAAANEAAANEPAANEPAVDASAAGGGGGNAAPAAGAPYAHSPYTFSYPPLSRRLNNTAIASMVVSLASFATCPLLGLLGVYLGTKARNEIKTSGEDGDGMALAGIVAGWVATGFSVAVCVIYAGIFGFALSQLAIERF